MAWFDRKDTMTDPYAEACFDAIPWITVAIGAKSLLACRQVKTPGTESVHGFEIN